MKLFNLFTKKDENPFAIKGDLMPYRKAVIKNIASFFQQEKHQGIFKGAFFSKFSASFLGNETYPPITEEDINEGVSLDHARYIFHTALLIGSLRSHQEENITKMRKAEPKRIIMKVFRIGTVDRKTGLLCPKAPKEKKFRPDADIPLYPCFDCECDPMCDIWYKAEF